MPAGRPDKYNEERHEQACDMAREGASLAGCGRAAGVHTDTIKRWLEKYPEFRDDFMRARAKGERQRLQGDSQQDRFILSTSFGYKKAEKREIDHTSSDGSMSPPDPIDPSTLDDDELDALLALQEKARESGD